MKSRHLGEQDQVNGRGRREGVLVQDFEVKDEGEG